MSLFLVRATNRAILPVLWRTPSTPDSLPVLGEAPGRPGLYLAFGHGHFGMTGGPPSGRLVARLITGATPPIDPAPYSIRRFRGNGCIPPPSPDPTISASAG